MIKNLKIILRILKDSKRKPILQMMWEVMVLLFTNKSIPYHYFSRSLFRTNIKNYKDYLTTPEVFLLHSRSLHNNTVVTLLLNKILFSKRCERYNVPVPKTIGYKLGHFLYINDQIQEVGDISTLANTIKNMLRGSTNLIVKEALGVGGQNIFKLDENSTHENLELVASKILAGDFIFQKLLTNHPDINQIYPYSVNTIRFDVCLDESNSPIVLGAVMRFGANKSIVDNIGQGGFLVSIDMKTGTLVGPGFSLFSVGDRLEETHPDTNATLDKVKVPFFKEAFDLSREVMKYFPTPIIGWDIAITSEGPVVIEGNHNTGIVMTEVAHKGYKTNPHILRLLKLSKGK